MCNKKCGCKDLKKSASRLAGYFLNLYRETSPFHHENMLKYEEAFKEIEAINEIVKK